MLSKFLDPKNDVCFKRVFGSKKNKDILIHFLNDMLQFQDHSKSRNSCLKSMTDKWAYFFKYAENTTEEEVKKLIKGDGILERLYKELKPIATQPPQITKDYKYNEGLEKGKKQGLEEGIEKSKIEITKNMLSLGID